MNVEEVSTFSSNISSTHHFSSPFDSGKRHGMSSPDTIDARQEKFLTDNWGGKKDPIGSLIDTLRQSTKSVDEIDRQSKLRSYIERLLQMKRQEIADLSVSSTTTSTTTSTEESSTLSGEITSTNSSKSLSNIIESSKSLSNIESSKNSSNIIETSKSLSNIESLLSNFSVEQVGQIGFASSTPSSILSSSESKSSVTKTVR